MSWIEISAAQQRVVTAVADQQLTGAAGLSQNGTLLTTGNADGTTRLWSIGDLAKPAKPLATLTGPTELIEFVAFSADTTLLATGSDDHRVHL